MIRRARGCIRPGGEISFGKQFDSAIYLAHLQGLVHSLRKAPVFISEAELEDPFEGVVFIGRKRRA